MPQMIKKLCWFGGVTKKCIVYLQKNITLIKKFDKGKQEWDKACVEVGLSTPKLKTIVKTQFARKVVFFK
jgi:hypothetical protein